jgi:hypothetical protein
MCRGNWIEEAIGMANGGLLGRGSRGLVAAAVVVGGLAALPGPAAAHVHGLTPLRCVGVENDGANRTDTTPAAAVNGGPISGLIPSAEFGTPGQSPLVPGDGGFDTPACPA